ncbi:hypothetical protein H7J88_06695 [Mycolicibacterium flavescens]|uniref:Uncharacterized protein n=1 Tax=Mycolicibacterium flavescens TaxID=1776 RepID=A0A1E3RQB9_MYCFV|nr:hypothetical protein [Mycolicibacterium flavescens]MCV7279332.1 hypothetical protein [Mycolicibacterium flavescens]ODQ92049.1 hypothetical protein BHQ18_04215 [Mycolicibacterium flavescens]
MKLSAEAGLWCTRALDAPAPLVAVLEVSGAVLSWLVDDADAEPQITFTDVRGADWLWRVVGETGHATVATALNGGPAAGDLEIAGVDVLPGALDALRRLAVGHWLRRWWPASHRDAIAVLDAAVLDGEIAVLTAGAQEFFGDDTFDSDVTQLLEPHAAALSSAALQGDPRIGELAGRCREIAEDVGVAWDVPVAAVRRDDYALAAGADIGRGADHFVASGVASINWSAVPAGVFDAAENTVAWAVEADRDTVQAMVSADLLGGGSPNGIPVRLRAGGFGGSGSLSADGRCRFAITGADGQPATDSQGWNHDWRATAVSVGAEVEESAEMRERVRALARSRLDRPGDDAFLAEILAAESDY